METSKLELGTDVLNYVIREHFDGDRDSFLQEIIDNRGFGGHPWYSSVKQEVRDMEIPFDQILGESDIMTELNMLSYYSETQVYFTDIKYASHPEYYDGFNKPVSEWTDEETDLCWDYHMDNDTLHEELYWGVVSYLNSMVEEFLITKSNDKVYKTLQKYLPQDVLDTNWYNMTEIHDENHLEFYDFDGETYFGIMACIDCYGHLEMSMSIHKEDDCGFPEEVIVNEDSLSVDRLDELMNEHYKLIQNMMPVA